jgi:hypothetical protein
MPPRLRPQLHAFRDENAGFGRDNGSEQTLSLTINLRLI